MRNEEESFAAESAARDRASRMMARLEKQRMQPSLTLADNLARIAELRAGVREMAYWPYARKQGRIFKLNQNWPNCWGLSS